MFTNYLKIAIRNIIKQKTYSFINIAGLAVGMASFILIALWVQDELWFDKFHKNYDTLYRVLNYEKYSEGEEQYFTQCPAAMAPVLKSDYPEMKKVTRVRRMGNIVVDYKDKRFHENEILFVDPEFFTAFTFPSIAGEENVIFENPHSVFISEIAAQKYFGNEDPIGKTIKFNNNIDLTITNILKDAPSNSHLQFNFIAPFDRLTDFGFDINGWNSYAYATYVLLDDMADYVAVGNKITNVIKDQDEGAIVTCSLQPMRDVHLRSAGIWGLGGNGNIKYVYIFSAIAIFVLLTACINFMNLSTARSGKRAKEVGLRKVIGANRKELIFQFFNESILTSIIAMLIAFVIVSLALPGFNMLSGKEFTFSFISNPELLIIVFTTVLITGIISGSYPALFLSSFQPVKTLKGAVTSGSKGAFFRRALVSFQFVLTICLIFGTLVINRQMHFIKNRQLGYNKDQVISVALQGDLKQKTVLLKTELKVNTNVESISAADFAPSRVAASFVVWEWEGNTGDKKFLSHMIGADENYLKTLDLEMVQGRFFSKEFKSDSTGVIVNESALAILGMENPIGKSIMERFHIVGIIKDFHFRSLHEKITPLVMFHEPNNYRCLLVKLNKEKIPQTISDLEAKWKNIVTEYPMEFQFLDQQIDRMYRADRRTGKIINIFTGLALFIAILGLFGMASFLAEQRTKEIGIRKVLGATVPGILTLLSKEFVKWVLIANVIAFPIGWFVMNKWLQNFAYRMELNIWLFIFSGTMALFIAISTVSIQAVKAAVANPVDSLKYE